MLNTVDVKVCDGVEKHCFRTACCSERVSRSVVGVVRTAITRCNPSDNMNAVTHSDDTSNRHRMQCNAI